MNQIFDTNRFMLSLHHYLVARGKRIFSIADAALGFVLLLTIFHGMAVYPIIIGKVDSIWSMLILYFWICLVATCYASTGMLLQPLGKKTTAIPMLMLPASQFEKYLCQFIICVLIPIVIFVAGFEIIDALRVVVVNSFFAGVTPACMLTPKVLLAGFDLGATFGITLIALVQSCFALGSSIWPRHGVKRTFCALVIIGVLLAIWAVTLLYLYPTETNYKPTYAFNKSIDNTIISLMIVLAVFNYVIAYFRFKEAEIINRF